MGADYSTLGRWHADEPLKQYKWHLPMVSFWMALTDAPGSLGFVIGSHDIQVREQLTLTCNMSRSCGPLCTRYLENSCVERFASQNPQHRIWWSNISAGDIIVFHGNTLHQGRMHSSPRLAACMRFRGTNDCSLGFTVHPRSRKTVYDINNIPWGVYPTIEEGSISER